jgi:kynurenine formamidase
MGQFIGDLKQGGPVNYRNISLNPHGNGTHTECLSHVFDIDWSIHEALSTSICLAQLITVHAEEQANGDQVILLGQLADRILPQTEAVVFRTTPNDPGKQSLSYSGKNPPYLDPNIGPMLCKKNILHLLVDLPSVDREEDGGALSVHRSFWNLSGIPRKQATITELVFVPNDIEDGLYLLNLQLAPFILDVAPSRPVLFQQMK